jgi:hypothetical protein
VGGGGWNSEELKRAKSQEQGISGLGIVVSGGKEGRRNMVDWQPARISIRFLNIGKKKKKKSQVFFFLKKNPFRKRKEQSSNPSSC